MTIDGAADRWLRALYGLRDDGAAFDRKVEEGLSLGDSALGKFSPSLAHDAGDGAPSMTTGLPLVVPGATGPSPADACLVSRHGDDFGVLARRSCAERFGRKFWARSPRGGTALDGEARTRDRPRPRQPGWSGRDLRQPIRLLIGHPPFIQQMVRQAGQHSVDVYPGPDWAGCLRSGRSAGPPVPGA